MSRKFRIPKFNKTFNPSDRKTRRKEQNIAAKLFRERTTNKKLVKWFGEAQEKLSVHDLTIGSILHSRMANHYRKLADAHRSVIKHKSMSGAERSIHMRTIKNYMKHERRHGQEWQKHQEELHKKGLYEMTSYRQLMAKAHADPEGALKHNERMNKIVWKKHKMREKRKIDSFKKGLAAGFSEAKLDEARRGRPRKIAISSIDPGDEPNNHIIMQLRKAVSLRGSKPVLFKSGEQKHVSADHAQRALDLHYHAKRPDQKENITKKLHHSYNSFKATIGV